MITVVKPGLLSTIQDGGRPGHRAFGMPLAGALDADAHAVANLLAGNAPDEATVEMTLLGATFRFDAEAVVGIAGADMQPALDGVPVAGWSSLHVPAGATLAFSSAHDACRCYLAVRGGIDVPRVLGSRSTYTRARVGGIEGRALRAGDVLPTGAPFALSPGSPFPSSTETPFALSLSKSEWVLPPALIPRYHREQRIRVLLGPQDDRFTAEGIATFLGSGYTVSNRNDRMGYQLDGPVIRHARGADIVSDGVIPGSVQVPGNGLPIVMMHDCATVGGYAKIATAIGADLAHMAQARTGDTVRFEPCTLDYAVAALRSRNAWLAEVAAAVQRGER